MTAEVVWLARKPLQRPLLLHVLNAHCESSEQAALKFPHTRMVKAVDPQQLAPFLHCLSSEQVWPRSREPAGAVIGAWPEGWLPGVPTMREEVAAVDDSVDASLVVEVVLEDGSRKPLQRPLLLHVLKAHCESSSQAALKFPQARIVSAVVLQHCAPFLHSLLSEHVWPRSREPGGEVTCALIDSASPAKRKVTPCMLLVI